MKKLVLAAAATALVAGLTAVKAAEPGEEQYFHERGNLDASAQRGWHPGMDGWGQGYRYGSGYAYRNTPAPLGFAPVFGPGDYDD